MPALPMAEPLPTAAHESAPQQPRIEPCVKDWTCAQCGCRLLLRVRVRKPGGCGNCGSLALEPSPERLR